MWKGPGRFYLFSLAVILADQAIKFGIKLSLEQDEEVSIIGDFFKLHFTENKGAAFGLTLSDLLPFLDDIAGKVILTLFSFCIVPVIIYFLHQSRHNNNRLPWLIALILGGALGNIIDRMFYGIWFAGINDYEGGFLFGRVVDMFYFDVWQGFLPNWIPIWGGNWSALWPIFNLADAAIFVGIIGVFVFQRKFFKAEEKETRTTVGSGPKSGGDDQSV